MHFGHLARHLRIDSLCLRVSRFLDWSLCGLTLSVCGKFEPENVQNASVPLDRASVVAIAGQRGTAMPRQADCCTHAMPLAAGISAFDGARAAHKAGTATTVVSAQSAQHSAQMGAGAERATEERPWRCSSSTSSTRCSACCLGYQQRRHRCRHHSTSRPSVARGGLPSRGLTVACARDVADCLGSVHQGCALMHKQQQASAAACWRARALGLSRCGLPRWCQGVHSGCSCACVRM